MENLRLEAEATAGQTLLTAMLDELKLIQDPWNQLGKDKQDDAIARLSARVQSAVSLAVGTILRAEFPATAAELGGVKFTPKGIQAVFHIARESKARHELADYAGQGKNAVIVLIDPEEWFEGMAHTRKGEEQRDLPLTLPPEHTDGLDEDDGLEDDGEPTTDLVVRLRRIGFNITPEADLWTSATPPQLAEIMNHATAVEQALAADGDPRAIAVPALLQPYARPPVEDLDTEDPRKLGELVRGLRENGLGLLMVEALADFTDADCQDVWDWIEVREAFGDSPTAEQLDGLLGDTREGYEAGAKLVEQLRMPSHADEPAHSENTVKTQGAEGTPAELKAALIACGMDVSGKEVASWPPWKTSAAWQYIHEFDVGGPANVPSFLEEFIAKSLQPQAGARKLDKWDECLNDPEAFARLLTEHRVTVPQHEVYAWTTAEREQAANWVRAVIAGFEAQRRGDFVVVGEQAEPPAGTPASRSIYRVPTVPPFLAPYVEQELGNHAQATAPAQDSSTSTEPAPPPAAGKKAKRKKKGGADGEQPNA